MLLEKSGRASSGKQSQHINIRYFFVHDRIRAGDVSICYCPTGEMVADFITKPLQGSLFKKLRDQIMNNNPATNGLQDCRSVLEKTNTTSVAEATDVTGSASGLSDMAKGADVANDTWTVVHSRKKVDRRKKTDGK
jgi:hypothetical protein